MAGKCISVVRDQKIYLVSLLFRVFVGTKCIARAFILSYDVNTILGEGLVHFYDCHGLRLLLCCTWNVQRVTIPKARYVSIFY